MAVHERVSLINILESNICNGCNIYVSLHMCRDQAKMNLMIWILIRHTVYWMSSFALYSLKTLNAHFTCLIWIARFGYCTVCSTYKCRLHSSSNLSLPYMRLILLDHILMCTPGGALVFEVGYHPRKKIHVIRVVHRLGVQKHAKLEKRVCFWSFWQILERTWRTN